jgi:AcrR family transcriptional regulator
MATVRPEGDTRQLILDTAIKLFIEKGVENTSLADISRTAEISKGTLYYHYRSKSDLVFDVTDQHFGKITSELIEWLDRIDPSTAPNAIFRVVLETILGAKTRSQLHHYLIQQALAGDTHIQERFRETYNQWKRMLISGFQKINSVNHSNLEMKATIKLAVLDGIIIQNMIAGQDISINALADELTLMFNER